MSNQLCASVPTIGIALLANLAASLVFPNFAWSLIATLLFALTTLLLMRSNALAICMLLPYLLLQLSMLVSLGGIEAGSYMPEVGTTGAPSSAAASYAIYSLIFDLVFIYTFRRVGQSRAKQHAVRASADGVLIFFQFATLTFATGVIIYLVIAGLHTGFPLLTGTDRFVFKRNSADALTVDFLDLKVIPTSALGVCAVFGRTHTLRIAAYLLFIAVIGLSFLYGEKFFIVIVAALIFAMPFFARQPERAGRQLFSLLPFALLGTVAVVAITLYIYSDWGARSLDFALQRFGDRISGQAQLWYLAVKDSSTWLNFDLRAIQANIGSLFADNPADYVFRHKLGPFFFVDKYSPPAIYRATIHNKGTTTPTELFEAYGLVMTGYIGLVVQMVLAGLAAGVISSLHLLAIVTKNPFYVFLPAFMITAMLKLVEQGTIYSALSISTFKFYFLFLALTLGVAAISRSIRGQTWQGYARRGL